jgi:hypothetical protein
LIFCSRAKKDTGLLLKDVKVPSRNLPVSDRGRIPAGVIEQYEAAAKAR